MRRSNSEESASYVFTPPTEGVYVVEVVPEGVEGMLMLFEDDYEYATSLLAVVQFSDLVWKKLRYAFEPLLCLGRVITWIMYPIGVLGVN